MSRNPEGLRLPDSLVPEYPPLEVVPARDASTVALLRDGADGLEVFMFQRASRMAFAGGMSVFPGGAVDPRDSDAAIGWIGDPPSWWAEQFGCSEDLAVALVCAAVRETFEECGVLLAGIDAESVVTDTSAYSKGRQALESGDLALARFLADEGLSLRADLLRPLQNWVTPEVESRRYDTYFFVAALPAGQEADFETTEAVTGRWFRPAEAMQAHLDKQLMVMPPTWTAVSEINAFGTVAEVLAAPRTIDKILPKLRRDDRGYKIALPDDPGYAD